MTIQWYEEKYEKLWDDFVLHKSINGTFLQSRNFLNYHQAGRFEDCSVLVFNDKGNLAAVVPACVQHEADGKKTFFSHKGSTYGGIVIDKKHYNATSLLEIIEKIEEVLKENNFNALYLKITPEIFCTEKPDLLEYLLYYKQYKEYAELNTYVDLEKYKSNILEQFNSTKRKHIKRLSKYPLQFNELTTDNEVAVFYELLKLNLKKHGVKPIHSLSEILDFKNVRLTNNVKFYGVFYGNKVKAAGMLFEFKNISVVHAQNLSTDPNDVEIDTIEYLYYSLIKEYSKRNYKYLSWGISTENCGKIINMGLIKNKESYGSTYSVNKSFYKEW